MPALALNFNTYIYKKRCPAPTPMYLEYQVKEFMLPEYGDTHGMISWQPF
jgi:hypothetical protein